MHRRLLHQPMRTPLAWAWVFMARMSGKRVRLISGRPALSWKLWLNPVPQACHPSSIPMCE